MTWSKCHVQLRIPTSMLTTASLHPLIASVLLHKGRRLMRGESCLAGFFKCASLSGLASFDRVTF